MGEHGFRAVVVAQLPPAHSGSSTDLALRQTALTRFSINMKSKGFQRAQSCRRKCCFPSVLGQFSSGSALGRCLPSLARKNIERGCLSILR